MIDDRYRSGIWYDLSAGQICEINVEDGDIQLVHPNTDEVFYTFDDADEFHNAQDEFRKIPEDAVNNPDVFYQEVVDYMFRKTELPVDDSIGFKYADENTEVIQKKE